MQTEKEVFKNIGLRLKKLREDKGFTSYEQFAVEFDLSRMHYWTIEKGRANITIRTLLHILSIHNLTVEDFFAISFKDESLKKETKVRRKKG